jgi:hypothetical protein
MLLSCIDQSCAPTRSSARRNAGMRGVIQCSLGQKDRGHGMPPPASSSPAVDRPHRSLRGGVRECLLRIAAQCCGERRCAACECVELMHQVRGGARLRTGLRHGSLRRRVVSRNVWAGIWGRATELDSCTGLLAAVRHVRRRGLVCAGRVGRRGDRYCLPLVKV